MFKKILAVTLFVMSTSVFGFNETEYQDNKHKSAPYMKHYHTASKKHNVPLSVLVRMGAIESGYWNKNIIKGKKVSNAGAEGIAQFMPRTARMLKIDPLNPEQAIDAQAKYLRMNYDRFGTWRKALMAYNWGSGNLIKKRKIPKSVQRYAEFCLRG
jgi:soluble lytic murein transglycosylase-like protein